MSYNGSGTFQINTTGQPVVAGTVISSTAFNALTADLATGLSTAITKDGQTATTARIPFAAGISSTLVTDSTSISTGSIITAGGAGIAKALYVGTTANIAGVLSTTSPNITTSITTPSTSFDLINATATTLNLGGAATAVNVGAATGTMTVANTTLAAKAITASTTLGVTGTTTLTGVATLTANPVLSAGTANGVTYLNGSKSLTSGSAITFDGTNFATTGTATATKLIPTGTSVTGNGLYLPAANALGLSTNGTNAVYIDSSQNVGIGVTPSTWSAGKAVEINTVGNSIWGLSDQINITNNAYYNTSYKYAGTGLATVYQQYAGQHIWSTAASGTAGNAITFTQAMTLNASGNLGIGTSSPNKKLEVVSAGEIIRATSSTGANDQVISIKNNSGTADTSTNIFFADRYAATSYASSYIRGTASGTSALIFATGGTNFTNIYDAGAPTERMRIDSVGNAYIETGLLWQYAPTPTTKAAAATLTAAELATDIITLTGTTYTITLPTGTALDTYYTGVPAVNIGYDFHIVNTASGIITIAVGASGMTSVGLLTVAATVSAHFRLRRTAANTYILYRLS